MGASKSFKLVTSSRFTRDAQAEANLVNSVISGYEIDLVDAHGLLGRLDVYNTKLPPLHMHSMFASTDGTKQGTGANDRLKRAIAAERQRRWAA